MHSACLVLLVYVSASLHYFFVAQAGVSNPHGVLYLLLLYRHKCFTGKYTTQKIYTKPHLGLDNNNNTLFTIVLTLNHINIYNYEKLKISTNIEPGG